ncbi:orotidine 5'-phosphate decarboxylase [Candidatus Dependentiae bacterium]|nr:orotidine 5'-phosphate decarboxylase [Candidatus Dependentiae bacterium]
MKLQIAFDLTDLDQAIAIAEAVENSADIIEVGSLLIYKHGVLAVQKFKERFPQKIILADTKIVDRSKDAVTLFAQSGADWITVMAGANKNVIHAACTIAHELGKKVMLDLLDASSLGQSALEAKSLGADALVFHKPIDDDPLVFLDRWDMVKGNTQLPVFISTALSRETLSEILSINPAGLVLGQTITQSQDPQQEAAYFAHALHG